MIKGVNKQVLEINETDNSFFEKAIFFVKPEYSGFSEGRLRENAKKELLLAGAPPKSGVFNGRAAGAPSGGHGFRQPHPAADRGHGADPGRRRRDVTICRIATRSHWGNGSQLLRSAYGNYKAKLLRFLPLPGLPLLGQLLQGMGYIKEYYNMIDSYYEAAFKSDGFGYQDKNINKITVDNLYSAKCKLDEAYNATNDETIKGRILRLQLTPLFMLGKLDENWRVYFIDIFKKYNGKYVNESYTLDNYVW